MPKKPTKLLPEIVQANIRAIRISRGITQQELANKTGLKVQAVSRIENSPQNLSLLNLEKLATALACPIEELISGSHAQTLSPVLRSKVRNALQLLNEINREIEK